MGVFIAQALTVLLGLMFLALVLALVALLTSRRELRLRPARVLMQRADGGVDHTDGSIRSVIEYGRAAPSRAPPTFLQARWDDSADASAGRS